MTALVAFLSAVRNPIVVSPGAAPANTVLPAISGVAVEGSTLSSSTGTWTGNPAPTYAYEWRRDGTPIGGATGSTYLLVTADIGTTITCRVTATNASGSASATSAGVGPIEATSPAGQIETQAGVAITDEAGVPLEIEDVLGDPQFSSVIALIPFNGTDGATTATDYSAVGRTLTFAGDAQIDTAISKFGGGSVMLDGVSGCIRSPSTADLRLHETSTEAFTVEFWAYFPVWPLASNPTNGYILARFEVTSGRCWAVIGEPASAVVRFSYSTNGTSSITALDFSDSNISAATWHHIAYDFDGTTFRAYVDGVVKNSVVGLPAFFNSTAILTISSQGDPATVTRPVRMHMEELRLTKGVSRYASAFTPPVAPFPRSG